MTFFVCGRNADIFLNHPAVSAIVPIPETNDEDGQLHLRFEGLAAANAMSTHLVDWYAEQIGVDLLERKPRLYLESIDFMRIQKYCTADTDKPKIAIAAGCDISIKLWEDIKWQQLCQKLQDSLDIEFVQIGDDGDSIQNIGTDLTAGLSARQAAALISTCDMVIGVDNGYSHLASAVGTPCFTLFGPVEPCSRIHDEAFNAIIADENECNGCMHTQKNCGSDAQCLTDTNDCMINITVEQVFDSVIELLNKNEAINAEDMVVQK